MEDRLQGLQDQHTRLSQELQTLENRIHAAAGAVEFAGILLKDALSDNRPIAAPAESQAPGKVVEMPAEPTLVRTRPPAGNSPVPHATT